LDPVDPKPPDARELAERTLQLCRIASPIGQEKAIADQTQSWALNLFGAERVFRHSHSLVVGTLEDPRPTLALFGHLDTVPAHPADGPPRIEGERVFGLGSSDMKGGLAVMMALAERALQLTGPFNCVCVFYEREEGPYLESGLGPLFERVPKLASVAFGIALEPTDNMVQVGCVGSIHATLKFRGKAAHSARPWQGENAIHRAGSLLAELEALPRREVRSAGFAFYEVFSATLASGGRARNVVPDEMQINLNYRFAPGKSAEVALEDIRRLVAGRAEIEGIDSAPSGRVCSDNPHFQRLLALTELPAESKQAWTDVARLSSLGIDAVNFGPGETAQAHQRNESASIRALHRAYEKLSLFLDR